MRLEKIKGARGYSQSSMKELGGVEDNPDPSSMRLKLFRHTVLTAMALWPIGARLSFSHFKIKGTTPSGIKMVINTIVYILAICFPFLVLKCHFF